MFATSRPPRDGHCNLILSFLLPDCDMEASDAEASAVASVRRCLGKGHVKVRPLPGTQHLEIRIWAHQKVFRKRFGSDF